MAYVDSASIVVAIVVLSVWARAAYARRIGQRIAALARRASGQAFEPEPPAQGESETTLLEKANREKDIFLAILSHELRGALTAVIGWLEIGRAHLDDAPTVRKALDIALRNARQQARIIDDLLDLSRIVAGKFEIKRQPLDLARVARDAVDASRPAAQEKHIELRCVLDEPVFIQGDCQRMLQAIGNLLANAIKFNSPGGWVELKLERAQAKARLVVCDNGAGIAANALPHIFERFWQAAAPWPKRERGLGLGLPLVHCIVECHGGQVAVESEGPGRGARFTVELPALLGTPALAAPEASRDEEKESLLNGLAVVALDRDDDTLGWLQHLFATHGAMTWKAHSVEEAVSLVEREHADLLISDLPITGGGDRLLEAVRARRSDKHTAAMAFSNEPTEDECKRAFSAGYDGFLAKPCDPTTLLRAVRAAVHRGAP